MRKLLLAALLCLAALPAFSQGTRYDDVVFRSTTGGVAPAASVTVTVCTSAGTGTPCTPTATIYTNRTLVTTQTNPFTTDGSGNYGFWAPPGTYVITFTGAGITSTTKTITLSPEQASSPTWTGAHMFNPAGTTVPLKLQGQAASTGDLLQAAINFAGNPVRTRVDVNGLVDIGLDLFTPPATKPFLNVSGTGSTPNMGLFPAGGQTADVLQIFALGSNSTINSKINAGGNFCGGAACASGVMTGDMSASRSATTGGYYMGTDGLGFIFRNSAARIDIQPGSPNGTVTQVQNGTNYPLPGVIFTQTALKTVTNTAVETSLLGTGVGSKTLPANFFIAGRTLAINLKGTYTGNGTITLVLKVKLGSTVMAATGTLTPPALSAKPYDITALVTFATVGASGTSLSNGVFNWAVASTNTAELDLIADQGFTVDTTASQVIDVTATWASASVAVSIQSNNATIQFLN